MRAIPRLRILGVFVPQEVGYRRIYIRFVESGKSEARQGSASEKCIWAMFYSFKKVVRLHFSRGRPRGASKCQVFPWKINGFARGNLFAVGQNHGCFLRNNWYFGGVAEATSRKVQTDYLFKAISEAPDAIFRCAPFRVSGF